MITVDDRTGSQDLYPMLRARGLPVQLGRMEFGDISWLGNGPNGEPISVGVEYKKISDVLSCMTDGRFAGHQLPGMMQAYQQPWLLIEGEFRARHPDGMLEVKSQRSHGIWYEASVGSRRFMYKDLLTWMFTIQTKGGIQIATQYTSHQTCVWISSLYNWWQEYDKHHSHLALHNRDNNGLVDRAVLVKPSTLRLVAKELPGVGWEKSAAIDKFFGTVENLVYASMDDLALVPGIGTTMARRIYQAIHGV